MEEKKLQFNNLQLMGNVFVTKNEDNMPGVLFLHGWTSRQNRFFSLAQELSEKGCVCLTFDLPGHGQSGGDISKLSIEKYLDAVIIAYDFLVKIPKVNPSNIVVIGSSFGSYLGALLVSKRPVTKLILRVPANYPDEDFQRSGRLKDAEHPGVMEWRHKKLDCYATESLKSVHNFTGDIFIVESGKDDIVPHQGVQNYTDAVTDKGKLRYTLMNNAPHSLSRYPEFIDQFNKMVVDWLAL